jgi:Zn ribbon nucleic-acid-binding protein
MGLFSRKSAAEVPSEVIDLRAPEPAKAQWGSPVPCPACTGRGYLDHIDPFKEIMFLHCTECGHKYEVTRAEIGTDDSSEAFTL